MDLVGKLFLPAAGRLSLPAVPASAVATPADGLCSELFTPGLPICRPRYQLRIVLLSPVTPTAMVPRENRASRRVRRKVVTQQWLRPERLFVFAPVRLRREVVARTAGISGFFL